MKKFILIFVAMLVLFTQTAFARNNSIISCDFSALPQDWEISNTSNATVEAIDGEAVLSFDTTASSYKARAEYISPTFALVDRYISIEMTTAFEGTDSKNLKKLTLKDDNVFNAVDIMTVSGSSLEFFGTEVGLVEENVDYSINIVIDTVSNTAIIYLDNEEVFNDTLDDVISDLNMESLYLDLRNYLSSKTKAAGKWYIDDFVSESANGISYSTDAQSVFKVSDISSFDIGYSGFIHADMLNAKTYEVYKNSEIVGDINVTESDGVISIVPSEGFLEECNYQIIMKESKNIFGENDGEAVNVSFRVVSDSYDESKNYINLTLQTSSEISEGQETSLLIEGAMQDGISCLEIYVDGSLYDTVLKESAEYTLTLSEGVHKIYAAVVSKTGTKQSSDTVTVTVNANEAPVVGFEGYNGKAYFNVNESRIITVTAEDSDGISAVELYNGDELLESFDTAPYTFDAGVLGLGDFEIKAVAYDSFRKSSEAVLLVNISNNFRSLIFEDKDFISVSDTSFKSGMNYSNQRGFCLPGEVDDEHGTSLLMGIKEINPNFTEGQYSYCQYPIGDNRNFILSYDVNVVEKPLRGSKNCVNMGIRFTGKETVTFLNIQDVFTASGKNFEYQTNKWYNIKFEVNQTQEKYRIYINDELFLEKDFKAEDYASKGEIQQFRFFSPVLNDQSCTVALDNMELMALKYAPTIKSIGYGEFNAPESIDSNAKSVNVYLSDGVKTEDVSNKKIKLFESDGTQCDIEVSYNSADYIITITPSEGFRSNEKYSVIIDKSVRIPSGEAIGGEIAGEFVTSSESLAVKDVDFSVRNGKVNAQIAVENNSDEEVSFVVVAAIFEGEKLIKTVANEQSVAVGEKSISLEYSDMMGKTMEIYVLDSLNMPTMLAEEIFTYGK